jgi:hypothetical protein
MGRGERRRVDRRRRAELQEKLDEAERCPSRSTPTDLRASTRRAHERERAEARASRAAVAEADALEAQSRELTEQMAAREKEKAPRSPRRKMPVEGLGFGEGVVTYNGHPARPCSSAEQLRVSLAIAMAANPKIRVIRIQDGSLLDDDSLAAVAEMAKANDYQVWIERVIAPTARSGILIEDGMVKGASRSGGGRGMSAVAQREAAAARHLRGPADGRVPRDAGGERLDDDHAARPLPARRLVRLVAEPAAPGGRQHAGAVRRHARARAAARGNRSRSSW